MRLGLGLIAALTLLAAGARAAPLDPALQQQLLALYEDYNKAIGAEKLDDALAMRSAEIQEEIRPTLAEEEGRKDFLEFSKFQAADSLEVLHGTLAKDGNSASILVIASKKIPEDMQIPDGPKPGSTVRSELTLAYVKEGGAWKLGAGTFGADPDKIESCKSEAFEPIDAYDKNRLVQAGGPIRRVAFNADHTLVIFRVVDEEDCAYLPSRDALAKQGVDPATLQPYAIVSIKGYRNKADKQKIWVDKLTVQAE